jgi:hypothetical protein
VEIWEVPLLWLVVHRDLLGLFYQLPDIRGCLRSILRSVRHRPWGTRRRRFRLTTFTVLSRKRCCFLLCSHFSFLCSFPVSFLFNLYGLNLLWTECFGI